MKEIVRVAAKDFEGYSFSLLQLFGAKGPKFNIKCGNCGSWFSSRIPIVDMPTAKCDVCNTINVLPLEPNR